MRQALEYAAAGFVLASLEWTPLPMARRLAGFYARLLDMAMPRLRRTAYRNLAMALPAAAAKLLQLESDLEGARLLMLQAAWMADNRKPNSLEASMAKAKAGRVGSDVTLSCVELCGAIGYGETELLEKWARDSKILDIFEGTQQIQQLIVARRVLGLTSSELR